MPTSSTFAPMPWAAPIMRARLRRVSRSGRPRSASLAPSSITTTDGRWRTTASTIRAAPPAVVSPLMLALTTRQPGRCFAIRSAVSATQPCAADRPYAAESESPITSTVRGSVATNDAGRAAGWACSAHVSSSATQPMAH